MGVSFSFLETGRGVSLRKSMLEKVSSPALCPRPFNDTEMHSWNLGIQRMVLPIHRLELQPALQFGSKDSILKLAQRLVHYSKGVRQHRGMYMTSPPMLSDNSHTQCSIYSILSWPLNCLGNNSSLVRYHW